MGKQKKEATAWLGEGMRLSMSRFLHENFGISVKSNWFQPPMIDMLENTRKTMVARRDHVIKILVLGFLVAQAAMARDFMEIGGHDSVLTDFENEVQFSTPISRRKVRNHETEPHLSVSSYSCQCSFSSFTYQ